MKLTHVQVGERPPHDGQYILMGEMRWLGCLLFLAWAIHAQESTAELARRAVAEHKSGDLAAAIRDYRVLLKGHPEYTKVRTNLASALTDLNRLDEAIAVLEAAPARERTDPEIQRGLALAYYRMQRLPEAARELEKLSAAAPTDLKALEMLADCQTRSGHPEKAIDLLEPVVAAHPADGAVKYQLGAALVRAGRVEQGVGLLEEAGRKGEGAEALLLAGATALDLGQFQRARTDLDEAIRLDPAIPGAWTWAGMARDRVSDEEGAKLAFKKALEANAGDFEATFHLGAILYREREIDSARPYMERAVALQPSSPMARYALALVRSASGETEKAVQDLEAVITTSPYWLEPHIKLASLYFRLRRNAEGEREKQTIEVLRSEHKEQQLPMPALDK